MSWLSRFSLAQRALIGLMSIIALVFGAIAIPQLKQQLLPTIEKHLADRSWPRPPGPPAPLPAFAPREIPVPCNKPAQ